MAISSFIIMFRETLEAALIVGIVLAYLAKTKRTKYNNIVYLGVAAAIVASIVGALFFNTLAGGFTGRAEEIFEGIVMLLAAVLLTFMILWMMRQRHIALNLHRKIETKISGGQKAELFLLVFVAVLREGIETVIFLEAAALASLEGNGIVASLLGIIAAIVLGYLIFVVGKKINLKRFFNVTSVLLILFAVLPSYRNQLCTRQYFQNQSANCVRL